MSLEWPDTCLDPFQHQRRVRGEAHCKSPWQAASPSTSAKWVLPAPLFPKALLFSLRAALGRPVWSLLFSPAS